ncbi:MAG: threonine/serine exporter family protein [Peptoniphilaceae bacterium]|nr:threonine/serine exporter family protein [Peptoniphilaceae bacterium]MDY6085516.1 threonine/serine exporter family protein [Peptoniphilaceae bacterium]
MNVLWQFLAYPIQEPAFLKYVMEGIGAGLAVVVSTLLLGESLRLGLFNAIIGAISWDVFSILSDQGMSNFAATLLGAMVVGLAAQFGAVHFRAPMTEFIIPSLYPLVPGALLYRTVNAFFMEQMGTAGEAAIQTMIAAIAIALGLLLVETSAVLFRSALRQVRKRRESSVCDTQESERKSK